MASADVQVASKTTLFHTVESFLNDSAYRDAIENSVNYNTRLCIERRLRMPFLDHQTGIAQTHSNLFMNERQRMPGLLNGQVYTYPAKRWRKKRRQYLMSFAQPKRKEPEEVGEPIVADTPVHVNEDSRDSMGGASVKDEPQDWYYDELEIHDMEGYDEPEPDSDYDYEDTYAKKRRRRSTRMTKGIETPVRSRGNIKNLGRGRRRGINYTIDYADAEKPYCCGLCGARYKTRPGLTYHYTHSHKEKVDDENSSDAIMPPSPSVSGKDMMQGKGPEIASSPSSISHGPQGEPQPPQSHTFPPQHPQQQPQQPPWGKFQDNYMTYLNSPQGPSGGNQSLVGKSGSPFSSPQSVPIPQAGGSPQPSVSNLPSSSSKSTPVVTEDESSSESSERKETTRRDSRVAPRGEKPRVNPSPYCDFCLGNEEANKKSGQPEELVSCSDCGRSGHPTCLQFTANMIISVRKYRWQCIECKCCSDCGTSDNDDQLLFCDDCDRGYHMYCLTPPLSAPPEGSWSCRLCVAEFHTK